MCTVTALDRNWLVHNGLLSHWFDPLDEEMLFKAYQLAAKGGDRKMAKRFYEHMYKLSVINKWEDEDDKS